MSTGRRRAGGKGRIARKRSEKSQQMRRTQRERDAAGEAAERVRQQQRRDRGREEA